MRLGALIFCAFQAAAQTPCMLHGTVIDRATGKGLAKAHVLVSRTGETLVRTTGEHGEFCFEAVAAGLYQVSAQKVGYLESWYKARPGRKEGQIVSVQASEDIPDLKLEMVAQAVLSGLVVGADGDAASGAQVIVYRRKRSRSGDEPDEVAGGQSDDRGRFRFADLPPGTYYISVQYNGEYPDEEIEGSFYPGGAAFAGAKPIILEAGHDVGDLTLLLGRPDSGPRRHLSGKVSPPVGNGRLTLKSMCGDGASAGIAVNGDGSFSNDRLKPCRYTVELFAANEYARLEVDLTASDAKDLTIVPQPLAMADIPLIVRTEGDGPPFRFDSETWVSLNNEQEGALAFAGDDGVRKFQNIRPGTYRLNFSTGNQPYFVKQIRFGGHAVREEEIDVESGATGAIEVVVSPNVASIEGQVTGAAERLVTVLLVDAGEPQADGFRAAVADQQGKFKLERIRPGKYRLFAIEDFSEEDWRPDLAGSLKGVAVELAEKEQKQIDVALIPSAEWEAAIRK